MRPKDTFLEIIIEITKGTVPKEKLFLLDWVDFFYFVKRQKITPLVFNGISHLIPDDCKTLWEDEYNKIIRKIDVLCENVKNISRLFEQNNVPSIIIKGMPLSVMIYGSEYDRASGDIDILLEEQYIPVASSILTNNSYVHACGRPDPYVINNSEIELLPFPIYKQHNNHELFEFIKIGEDSSSIDVFVELGRYLHSTIKDQKFIKSFIDSKMSVNISGTLINTTNLEHTLIYLCENAYTDSLLNSPRLKDFVDIFYFIRKYETKINYNEFSRLLKQYNIVDKVGLALQYTYDIFNDKSVLMLIGLLKSLPLQVGESRYWLIDEQKEAILSLLFESSSERSERQVRILKDRCFSSRNENFCAPFIVPQKEDGKEPWNESPFLEVVDGKYGFAFSILPTFDNEFLYFLFKVEEKLFHNLGKFEVKFSLIDNTPEKITLIDYWITSDNGEIVYRNESERYVIEPMNHCGEGFVLLKINLPLIMIGHRYGSNIAKIAFCATIVEQIYGPITHTLALDTWDIEFWESPPILEVNIVDLPLINY
ncbi:hypothetical protein E6C60_0680 [Paenibacillus algicola]|uniref:Uncharacterized protein n=1 Tax=Paenibacillus algicola TaxID=2565926 RepID=A0A4P8XG45_9BACL|nr:nucleotidyltransferase family protein [Paenibacillus algicola]QCT01402.1 hypothetical protein E6C60_0680 [Paenibacillus algicola]